MTKKMTGILLIIFGLISLASGIFLVSNAKKSIDTNSNELQQAIDIAIADGVITENERRIIKQLADKKELDFNEVISHAEGQMAELEIVSETELIDFNKKNGDDFEKFIVKKFNNKYFTIKEWAGDKYIDGIYADTTQQPDLRIELLIKKQASEFSVECKWRQKLEPKGLIFAYAAQIKRYKAFEEKNKIPVFIAIGIGGVGFSTERLFIVPLKKLDSNFIAYDDLMTYEKNVESDFYFDIKTKELR